MAEVTLTVNDRSFNLACADGDEKRMQKLAEYVDYFLVILLPRAPAPVVLERALGRRQV